MRSVVCPSCGKNTNVNISETGGRTRTRCPHCKVKVLVETNREGKIESVESDHSGCFVATACASATVSPERYAEELAILREYRDSYFVSLSGGEILLSDYYRDAPKIVRAIQARRDGLEKEYIAPSINLILANKSIEAFDVYKALMKLLRQNYLNSDDIT